MAEELTLKIIEFLKLDETELSLNEKATLLMQVSQLKPFDRLGLHYDIVLTKADRGYQVERESANDIVFVAMVNAFNYLAQHKNPAFAQALL